MAKARKPDLMALTPDELIERFVTESKLSDPMTRSSIAALDEHGARWRAIGAEIVARGGSDSLIQLMELPDNWVAYCAADALVDQEKTRELALATLDRIADEKSGSASSWARSTRNMVRYGDPQGDPIELEKRLTDVREREAARKKLIAEIRVRNGG